MGGASERRKLIAALTVTLPILAGIAIVAIGHFFGHETDTPIPRPGSEPPRAAAVAPAAVGTPAPRVRLVEGATGTRFDSASLGSAPYAVVFIATGCETIGDYLGRVVAELREGGTEAAILAISSDPGGDSPEKVSTWLSRHHLESGPFHYLVGTEEELLGYWNAWGLTGPSPTCGGSVPAHLVSGSGINAGVVDLDPQSPSSLFADTLRGMSG